MNIDDILRHCECGMCGHQNESDCLELECTCCFNFHIRAREDYNSVKNDLIEEKQRFQYINKH